MNVPGPVVQHTPAGYLDDEITALTLQREEIVHREDTKKGNTHPPKFPTWKLPTRITSPKSMSTRSF